MTDTAALGHYFVNPGVFGPALCRCGFIGGNGTNRPLLATHLARENEQALDRFRESWPDLLPGDPIATLSDWEDAS